MLLAAAYFCPLGSGRAQKFDLSGQVIERAPMKAAHDSTILITVHPLAPGVYAALNRFVWNGWVELPEGILVIDGGYDARSARALADTIRARSGPKPIRYLVVTSSHAEHVGGVRTFASLGAKVLAHSSVVASIRDSLPDHAAAEAESSRVLGPSDRRVEVCWLGRKANSAGDLVVYLPKQSVLFTGDLAWYRSVPWLVDPQFDCDGWLASLDTLLTPRFDADSLVPGHGPSLPSRTEGVMFTRRYLSEARSLAASRVSWNARPEGVFGWGELGAYEQFEYYDPVHFYNVRRLYLLAKGIRTPGRARPGVVAPPRDDHP
ncbi:MAG TPA: MBL fold metallo-hydrolase [Candidatus Eisenbacteria bacterium]